MVMMGVVICDGCADGCRTSRALVLLESGGGGAYDNSCDVDNDSNNTNYPLS